MGQNPGAKPFLAECVFSHDGVSLSHGRYRLFDEWPEIPRPNDNFIVNEELGQVLSRRFTKIGDSATIIVVILVKRDSWALLGTAPGWYDAAALALA